eukprot:jgi/Chlat1/5390/Chrsp35S05220
MSDVGGGGGARVGGGGASSSAPPPPSAWPPPARSPWQPADAPGAASRYSGRLPRSDVEVAFRTLCNGGDDEEEAEEDRKQGHHPVIDKESLREGLRKLKLPCGDSYVEGLIRAADTNHDGKLDYAEFERFVDERDKEVGAVFDALDMDRSGLLYPHEVAEGFNRLGIKCSERTAKALITSLDQLDYHEFRRGLMLLPALSAAAIFQYWERATAIDLGDTDFTLPDEPAESGPHTSATANALRNLLCGAIAGVFSRTATAPIDRLKTLMMAQRPDLVALGPQVGGGVWPGLQAMYIEGGVRGFWRGNFANCIKVAPEQAVKFFAYDFFKSILVEDPKNPSVGDRLLAGGMAGMLSQFIVYPLDLVKTRLSIAPSAYNVGILGTMRHVARTEGVRSLWHGLTPSLIGIFPYASVDLAVFSMLKDFYTSQHPEGKSPGALWLLGSGAVSSTCGQLVSFPLMVVRTRLQAQDNTHKHPYNGMLDCFAKVYKYEGIRGLYRGLIPNFLKTIPATGLSYFVYETSKQMLS